MTPIARTTGQLVDIVWMQLQKILLSNVTVDALSSPSTITSLDVIMNLHLGTAYEALKALKGYTGDPCGYVKDDRTP